MEIAFLSCHVSIKKKSALRGILARPPDGGAKKPRHRPAAVRRRPEVATKFRKPASRVVCALAVAATGKLRS